MTERPYSREAILDLLKTEVEVDLVEVDDEPETRAILKRLFGNHSAISTLHKRDIVWKIVSHAQARFTFGLVWFHEAPSPPLQGGGLAEPDGKTLVDGDVSLVGDEIRLRDKSGAVWDLANGMLVDVKR